MAINDIQYFVIDVDGTMTDAGIYYDNNGNELKKFCTKDAAGFFAAYNAGIKIVVLTGRECEATARRMKELKVQYLYQNIKNKQQFLQNFMDEHNIKAANIGYIGDDLNDYLPMSLCGFKGCPQDSCNEIKELADYISPVLGGHGAVRDIIEYVLKEHGVWEQCISKAYGVGV